jgi:hypothetical protein
MSSPGPRLLKKIDQAAGLRAAGHSWAVVAEKTGETADRCEAWSTRFPRVWGRRLRWHLRQRVVDGLAEAVSVLRVLVRDADKRLRRPAAVGLLQVYAALRRNRRRRERPREAPDSAALRLAAFASNLGDGELTALVEELIATHQSQHDQQAASPDGPGLHEEPAVGN